MPLESGVNLANILLLTQNMKTIILIKKIIQFYYHGEEKREIQN